MAALDFPHLGLSIGQTYPNPPVAGQPVYTWDGEKWTAGGTTGNIYIADAAPAAPVGSLWWESDTGILYVRYNDGTSTQWVAIAGSNANAVVYDTVQSLTEAQKATARSNVYAAPFDALAYNGMQVNGSMEIDQANAGVATIFSNAGKYIIDGWVEASIGVQNMVGVRTPSVPAGYSNSLQCYVSGTANASPAAGDFCIVYTQIEGYRIARLAWGTASAQPLTIAFWMYAHRPGNYSLSVMNAAGARNYAANITINSADTWEYKVITVPGDTAGTWAKDNTPGLIINIAMMAGSGKTTAAGAWVGGGPFYGATGTINGVAATTDFILLTGVVVLPGIEAPSAARSPLIMRPYDQELVTCKRYYQKIVAGGSAIANGSTTISGWSFPFPVEMRSPPTASLSGAVPWTTAATSFTVASISSNLCLQTTWSVHATASVTVPTNPVVVYSNTSPIFCIADARL